MEIPTYSEIMKSEAGEEAQENAFNVILNQTPPKSWIKEYKGIPYLSIDKVRFMLTRLFVTWNVEVRQVQQMVNSVVCTVRLHYKHPITKEMRYQDGVGGFPIHTKSKKGAMDWNEVNFDSVQKAAPNALTFAEKNAAKKIGCIFGMDMGKEDTMNYEGLMDSDRFKDAKITEKP
jgi:hypothetical protein